MHAVDKFKSCIYRQISETHKELKRKSNMLRLVSSEQIKQKSMRNSFAQERKKKLCKTPPIPTRV